MNVHNSTPSDPENTSQNVLNLRWRFFKSRHTGLLAKSFACSTLSSNPQFIEISEAEYRQLEQEQNNG